MSLELPTANSSEPDQQPAEGGRRRERELERLALRRLPVLLHEEHDGDHAEQAGDDGDGEDPAQRDVGLDEGQRDERAEHRAHRVHGAVQAEREALLAGLRVRRDEVVARRRAHALAEPVGEAAGEGHPPARRERDDELAERAERVAAEHEGLAAAGVVGGLPERVLGDARGRLGDALDQPEERDRRAEHRGDEDREQRVGDLRAEVGEQADEPERAHVGVEGAQACEPAGRGRAGHAASLPLLSGRQCDAHPALAGSRGRAGRRASLNWPGRTPILTV